MEYPIIISDQGTKVEQLKKKVVTTTYSSYGSVSRDDVVKALELCEHSGFVIGAIVTVRKGVSSHVPKDMVVKGFKSPDEAVYRFSGSKGMGLESVNCIIVGCDGRYSAAYCIEELELV